MLDLPVGCTGIIIIVLGTVVGLQMSISINSSVVGLHVPGDNAGDGKLKQIFV